MADIKEQHYCLKIYFSKLDTIIGEWEWQPKPCLELPAGEFPTGGI